MIPTPNIPTDNLYKFLSISGLTMIILSISSLYFNSKVLNTQIIETNRKIAKFGYETDYLRCEISEINNILDNDFPINGDTTNVNSGRDSICSSLQKTSILKYTYAKEQNFKDENFANFLDIYTTYLKYIKQLDSLAIEISYDIKQVDYKNILLKRNKRASGFGIFFGCLISVCGFYLWYNKSQKFIDKKTIDDSSNITKHNKVYKT